MRPSLLLLSATALLLAACDGSGAPPAPAADASAIDATTSDAAPSPSPSLGPFSESCAPDKPAGKQTRTLTANNGAELAGVELGSPDFIAGVLRRKVTVTVRQPSVAFEVGPAFVLRSSEDASYLSLVVTVKNPGAGHPCFITGQDIRWLAADGTELVRNARTFVTGSVGDLGGFYTDTCLASGELGYLLDIEGPMRDQATFSAVTSIELSFASDRDGIPAPASLVATAYAACQRGGLFEVALESRGPEPVGLWRGLLGHYVLLDEEGPLDWGLLDTRRGLGIYEPGKVTVAGSTIFHDGTGTRLHVFTSFDDTRDL